MTYERTVTIMALQRRSSLHGPTDGAHDSQPPHGYGLKITCRYREDKIEDFVQISSLKNDTPIENNYMDVRLVRNWANKGRHLAKHYRVLRVSTVHKLHVYQMSISLIFSLLPVYQPCMLESSFVPIESALEHTTGDSHLPHDARHPGSV